MDFVFDNKIDLWSTRIHFWSSYKIIELDPVAGNKGKIGEGVGKEHGEILWIRRGESRRSGGKGDDEID